MKSAIVIPCFNRVDTLLNLLKTIFDANIDCEIDLVFSIDYSGTDNIAKFAKTIEWEHGTKRIIQHPTNIGLRSNILYCGDLLLSDYERIILLEDDLIVAPDFINYALSAADYYDETSDIAGISLFSYNSCEEGLFDFFPLKDGYDTFFIQWPSSWGQLWTRKQWKNFREWLSLDYDFSNVNLPQSVKEWTNSWKKYFAAYLVETNRYFVYPYFALSGETCAAGVHYDDSYRYSFYNNSMQLGYNWKYRFRPFHPQSLFRYDCFFQLFHRTIEIDDTKFLISFDLYGTKCLGNITTPYVITSKTNRDVKPIFGHKLLPFELNILNQIKGDTFYLLTKEQFKEATNSVIIMPMLRQRMSVRNMACYIKQRLFSKIKQILS